MKGKEVTADRGEPVRIGEHVVMVTAVRNGRVKWMYWTVEEWRKLLAKQNGGGDNANARSGP
jgi:hypothetical protein